MRTYFRDGTLARQQNLRPIRSSHAESSLAVMDKSGQLFEIETEAGLRLNRCATAHYRRGLDWI